MLTYFLLKAFEEIIDRIKAIVSSVRPQDKIYNPG